MAVLLVHLSDIHFRRRKAPDVFDLDADVRNELERDCAAVVKRLGRASRILVTGDIAFSGLPTEYEEARSWLEKLCGLTGCATEDVLTVPGNHDVDCTSIDRNIFVGDTQQKLRSAQVKEIDDLLRRYLQDYPDAAVQMYEALRNYNSFAAPLRCAVSPTAPVWQDDIQLQHEQTLRIVGLNSTLSSHYRHDDDGANRLILGSYQLNLPRLDCIHYLTMCHHPIDWLKDRDEVGPKLIERARVQLFGHKHLPRQEEINNNSLRIAAGAVHPERRETWCPTYNLLEIDIVPGDEAAISIRVWPRRWDSDRLTFRADHDADGVEFRKYELPIRGPIVRSQTPTKEIPATDEVKPAMPAAATSQTGRMKAIRRLTYRFLTLPFSKQMEIAQTLGILSDEDKGAKDRELFERFFERARDRDLLAQLWDETEKRHDGTERESNPFRV